MAVNDIQIGGNHYKKMTYQHWDFVVDTGLHYLLGCATKYVARWREKNGVEDLRKALHYLSKAEENNIIASYLPTATNRFCSQLEPSDARIIINIMDDNIPSTIVRINLLISNEVSGDEPDKNYTNQDKE